MEASLSYLPYNSKIKCFAVYSETQLSWLLEPALNCTQKTQRKLSAPSKRTDGKLGAGAKGTGGGEVTQKSMKRAIMNVPFRSMGPSWGLLWFLLRKNTFPDHRLQKSIETKKIPQRSTFSPLRRNASLCHPFLFLPWLWQNKPTNRYPAINHAVDTLLYLGDARREILEPSLSKLTRDQGFVSSWPVTWSVWVTDRKGLCMT